MVLCFTVVTLTCSPGVVPESSPAGLLIIADYIRNLNAFALHLVKVVEDAHSTGSSTHDTDTLDFLPHDMWQKLKISLDNDKNTKCGWGICMLTRIQVATYYLRGRAYSEAETINDDVKMSPSPFIPFKQPGSRT